MAIALRNARLHAALEERSRQLEEEKKRVTELAELQAREIVLLTARNAESSFRYDYGTIVGTSAAMRSVFSLLDQIGRAHV